jgi:hypothetical protein
MKKTKLFNGHEVWAAWKGIWRLFDSDAATPQALAALAGALTVQRESVGTALPEPDDQEIAREERRGQADPDRVHPVWDPSWYTPNQKRLWIPWAKDAPSGAKRGKYPGGYPAGLVLHWTAGHRDGLVKGNALMRSTGMLYLLGDRDGNLAQSDPLSHWGYHAGPSSFPTASGTVSDEFVGLELQAWGKMVGTDPYKSWAGYIVPPEEVRRTERRRGNIEAGSYHIYTDAQVNLARRTCLWLHLNWPDRFRLENVVGHDEVSPGRKADPGGAIWLPDVPYALTMSQFRDLLKDDLARVQSALRKA